MKRFCPKGHDTFKAGRTVWNRCRRCHNATQKKWRKAHPQETYESSRDWQQKHRKLINQRKRKRYAARREEFTVYRQKYRKQNRGSYVESNRRLQLTKLHRVPNFGQEGIKEFYRNCPKGMEVDHIIPIHNECVSGLHVIWNLQYLTPEENNRKNNSFWGREYAKLR